MGVKMDPETNRHEGGRGLQGMRVHATLPNMNSQRGLNLNKSGPPSRCCSGERPNHVEPRCPSPQFLCECRITGVHTRRQREYVASILWIELP